MNIKEKLEFLGIDIKNDKDSVNLAKEELKKAGFVADRIVNKLDPEGEKILEKLFSKKIDVSTILKDIKAPATIKKDADIPKKNANKNAIPHREVEQNTKENKTEDDNKEEKIPFWKKSLNKENTNIKIRINNGSNKNTPATSPNGRPLPQSTIDKLKKIKENKENQNKNVEQKQNTQVNKNQQKNQNDNKHNKQKTPNKDLSNTLKNNLTKKVTINTNNAEALVGTNNKFVGKQKDKDKNKTRFNKEFENKKTNKTKPAKKDKHIINEKNYENKENATQYKARNKKTGAGAFIKPVIQDVKPTDDIKSIELPEVISIKDLSSKLKLQPSVIVKKLFMQGKMVNPNTELSYEEAENIALEYDILCEKEVNVNVIEELLKETDDDPNTLIERPPVVCVMGHVDHGKTSILDAIRKTHVIEKEAGGITQHIGAYQVKINDRLITFLDTPGHEAFTAMRMRGAKSTDIAVLVVAADDGVKPQTIEAINHAKAANVEVVVAINKIDKPEANVDRVKQELSEYELIPADWGGKTTFCEVSAKKNIGIQNLLEMILLTADVMELKANPNRKARGIVIEAELDKGKGPVARIIVQKGTLKIGNYIAMGKSFGKIRAMIDCNGNKIDTALPSTPVEILGLNDTPQAGDTFICFDSEKDARAFAETFISENKQKLVEDSRQNVSLDALFEKIKAGEIKELPIIVKADVVGSVEAIKNSLEKLSNEEVSVKVIHEGVGNINESDITLASASNAIIIGFNVKYDNILKALIDKENIDVRLYNIIYNAIEDVEKAMKGMLKPVYEEKVIGHLTIRQIFKASNIGNIAGCLVNDGEIRRNCKVRIFRKEEKIYEGELLSLKRFKDEVKEVKQGFECGLVVDGFNDYNVDDTIETYVIEEKDMSSNE